MKFKSFAVFICLILALFIILFLHFSEKKTLTDPAPELRTVTPVPLQVCTHPSHDRETQICITCGQKVWHEYENGLCRCGEAFRATADYFDPSLWESCSEQGRMETVEYQTRDSNGDLFTKHMEVYLPYGYNPKNQYNVLVLLHGFGGDEHYWFKERGYVYPWGDSPWVKFSAVLDNMISRKLCRPVIVISPTFYLSEEQQEDGVIFEDVVQQIRYEVLKDILPAIVNRYSTFAEGDDYQSLCRARDHFGFLGASYGGMICCNSILTYDIDVFSWIAAVSGLHADVPEMKEIWEKLGFSDLEIHYLYTSAGENDTMREDTETSYASILELSPKITEQNICCILVSGAEHEERVWDNAVYDCLRLFFGTS